VAKEDALSSDLFEVIYVLNTPYPIENDNETLEQATGGLSSRILTTFIGDTY